MMVFMWSHFVVVLVHVSIYADADTTLNFLKFEISL